VLIDWFTVCAQIVNFLVLVALLKHFLYGPIIRAMDAREQTMADRLAESERRHASAEAAERAFQQKNREIAEKSAGMLAMAKQDAESRRAELIEHARLEVLNLKTGWQDAVKREQEAFVRHLRQMAGSQIYAISRRALTDLCCADLEDRTVDVFLARLQEITPGDRQKFAEAVETTGAVVTVRSAFPLSPAVQDKLTAAVRARIDPRATVGYETVPELIMGLELKTRGHKISWSMENYLKILETRARSALAQTVQHMGG
jgi:F-type H+-transporting ATPase subunit b